MRTSWKRTLERVGLDETVLKRRRPPRSALSRGNQFGLRTLFRFTTLSAMATALAENAPQLLIMLIVVAVLCAIIFVFELLCSIDRGVIRRSDPLRVL